VFASRGRRPQDGTFARRIPTELAVHIRLRRVGKTKAPTYRVVIADSRAPRNGKFIETIGHYDPLSEPARLVVDAERARHWFKNGARPTSTTRSLLIRSGIPEGEVPASTR
jgi:small subunit ribosomal protein S16